MKASRARVCSSIIIIIISIIIGCRYPYEGGRTPIDRSSVAPALRQFTGNNDLRTAMIQPVWNDCVA